MTARVYDPNNQMFEVSDARAAELVLNHGWTRQPTTTVPVESAPPTEPEIDWRDLRLSQDDPDPAEQIEADLEAPAAESEVPGVDPAPSRRRRKR